MTVPPWESSGGVKIERAKKHVLELETEIETYRKRDPYEPLAYVDDQAKPRHIVVRARVSELPPLELGAIAGDAIHNLRSALDILWVRVMHPNRVGRANRRGDGFPFFASAKECEARPGGKKESRSDNAIQLVKRLKPYPGGNDPLWRVHALDIADKHHLLIPTIMAVRVAPTELTVTGAAEPLTFTLPDRPIHPVEDGTVLFELRADSFRGQKLHYHTKFTFAVSLGELEVGKGEPILATVHQCVGAVESVVETFITAGLIARTHGGPPESGASSMLLP